MYGSYMPSLTRIKHNKADLHIEVGVRGEGSRSKGGGKWGVGYPNLPPAHHLLFGLNKLPHTIYWKSRISILGKAM